MIVYEEGQNYIRIVEHIHDARVKMPNSTNIRGLTPCAYVITTLQRYNVTTTSLKTKFAEVGL